LAKRPFLIALLGGIASGKSRVSALFRERGAVVLCADEVAHELLTERTVKAEIRAAFGAEIFEASGEVDRKLMAARVFQEPTALKELEEILHPRVRKKLQAQIEELSGSPRRVVILDVPLAAEAGYTDEADLVAFIETAEVTRIARAATRGWTPAELRRRESQQRSLPEKRALAHEIIRNNNSLAEARSDVERIWCQVVEPQLA